ncbi:MFS transporter [soil metagenome]
MLLPNTAPQLNRRKRPRKQVLPGSVAPELASSQSPVTGAFAALRHLNFRWFYIGQLLSLTGAWMQSTAQGWLVLELTDSAFLLGLTTAAGSLPILLFTLYAGVAADRMDKRRIILTAQIAAAVLAITLAVLVDGGWATYALVLTIAFLLGITHAFEVPTRQAFFVDLVGKRDLPNAIALNSIAFNATRVVGPAVAGFLIASVGIAACFYANAVSYLAVIAALLLIRLPKFQRSPQTSSTLEGLAEGFGFLRRERRASALIGLIAAISILAFPYAMLLPVFARDVLQVGPRGLGWLLSATGAGAMLGGIVVAAWGSRVPRGRLLVIASLAFTLLLAGFSLSRSLPLSMLLLAGMGFTMILNNATLNALLQGLVPDDLRGRVMAVYVFMFLGMTPIGSLQAGVLARWWGAPGALLAGAALLFVILVLVWTRIPELRRLR